MARVVVRKEVERRREDHPVAKGDAPHAERRRERDGQGDRALAVLLNSRGEEGPELPEDDRQGEQERRVERDHDRGRERLDRAEGHRLPQPLRQRPVQPVEQLSVKSIRDSKGDRDRRERDDQSRTELAQVLDERGFLAVAKAPREPGHRAKKRREAGTCPRSGAAALASTSRPRR